MRELAVVLFILVILLLLVLIVRDAVRAANTEINETKRKITNRKKNHEPH